MSTTELAAKIGVAQSHISRLENGRVTLTLDILHRVAEALEVDPRWLIDAGSMADDTRYAPLKGELATASVAARPWRLIALPYRYPNQVDAFGISEANFLFGERQFPMGHEEAWVVRVAVGDKEELYQAELLGGASGAFWIRKNDVLPPAAARMLSFPVNDPRLKEAWRIISEFRTLRQGDWPSTFR